MQNILKLINHILLSMLKYLSGREIMMITYFLLSIAMVTGITFLRQSTTHSFIIILSVMIVSLLVTLLLNHLAKKIIVMSKSTTQSQDQGVPIGSLQEILQTYYSPMLEEAMRRPSFLDCIDRVSANDGGTMPENNNVITSPWITINQLFESVSYPDDNRLYFSNDNGAWISDENKLKKQQNKLRDLYDPKSIRR